MIFLFFVAASIRSNAPICCLVLIIHVDSVHKKTGTEVFICDLQLQQKFSALVRLGSKFSQDLQDAVRIMRFPDLAEVLNPFFLAQASI